jgi:hypothetical protein
MPGFDVAIPEADLEHLSPAAREQAIYWSYFHVATRRFVMSSDDDRFTNHSDDPNTRVAPAARRHRPSSCPTVSARPSPLGP